MPFAVLCLCLLLLLLLSEPLSLSAEGRDGVRIYIRLIFFGMIISSSGHTDRKRQKKDRLRQKWAKKAKRDTALLPALTRAVRFLLPRAALHIEYDPRIKPTSTPVQAGILTACFSALYGILSCALERVQTVPMLAEDGEGQPAARATLRASLLDILIAAGLFASAYIKRKDIAWQKRK